MAMLASTDKASNVFYCTNCKEKTPGPVTLACYHTVCRKCLEVHQSFSMDKHIYCPVCETNTQCSDETDSLRSQLNTCIKNASRTLEELLFKPEGEYCSVCCLHNQRNDVTHQCVDCGDVLCGVCQAGHQASSATYSHRVVAIRDVKTGKYVVEAKTRSFPCGDANHRGRAYAYFCQSCVIPICELCLLFQHKGHAILTLDEAAQNCATKLKERSQQLSTYMTESATPKLERFRNLERDISSIQEAALKSIRYKTQTAVDLILKQEQEAVKKLSKLCDQQLKLTSTVNTYLEQISNLCPKLLSLTNLVLRSGQDVAVLILHNDLEKCFTESKQLQDATDVFAPKLKMPVFDVRCDVPPKSVISITHSFQNPVVGDEDIKKDETIPSRKQAEGMKDVSSSTSLRPETCQQEDYSGFKLTESLMIVGEAGKALSSGCCSSGHPSEGPLNSMSLKLEDSTNVEVFAQNVIRQEVTPDSLMTEPMDKGVPDSPMTSKRMNGDTSDSPMTSECRNGDTSDSLMTSECWNGDISDATMTSECMKRDSSEPLKTFGPMTGDRFGPSGLNSSGASAHSFDDKQKVPGNVVTSKVIPEANQQLRSAVSVEDGSNSIRSVTLKKMNICKLKVTKDTRDPEIKSLGILNDKLVIADNANKKIRAMTTCGTLTDMNHKNTPLADDLPAHTIACLDDCVVYMCGSTIYITDRILKCLRSVMLRTTGSKHVVLCRYTSTQFLVGNLPGNLLLLCNTDGQMITTQQAPVDGPIAAISLSNEDDLLISSLNQPGAVFQVKKNGTLVRTFRPPNATEWYPEGTCMDKRNNLYVADPRQNQIHVFSAGGEQLCSHSTLSDDLVSPRCLAISSNRLFVSGNQPHLFVFAIFNHAGRT
ncbi:uncharacterized protein [Haliotis cracherodii]|uniref:uncharacterized protein n=1 Tax=Haliotis cracherodii TaxID=6455 RepID=UPI0039E9F64B